MSAYTPGPWAIKAYEDERFVEIKASNGYRVVASVPFNNGDRDANARLIAAAPELLEALFALLPHVEHADSCGDMDAYNNADVPTCGCGLDSARERANAAISRATGEGES